ncbi:NnrU family protein [Oceaniserpentilla sp. 4NH20-0058]
MDLLIVGLVLFFSVHIVSTIPPIKRKFSLLVGQKGYKPVYAIISLIGFVLIVMGYADKPILAMPQWSTPSWAVHLMYLILWLAIILQPASHMPTNIKRYTRHPMLWGVVLWSAMHLWVNADRASILLFGSFLAYSLWAMFTANLAGAKKQTKKVPMKHDVLVVVVGTFAYILVLFAHKWIAGVPLVNY